MTGRGKVAAILSQMLTDDQSCFIKQLVCKLVKCDCCVLPLLFNRVKLTDNNQLGALAPSNGQDAI